MKGQKSASRAWLKNKSTLLFAVLTVSFVFYFLCLCFVPKTNGEGGSLLRGCAAILALLLPALFYLRSVDDEGVSAPEEKKPSHPLWRDLLFVLGSFAGGVFLAQMMGVTEGTALLASGFAYPDAFSVASFSAMCAMAFAFAFLPFGLLGPHLAGRGSCGAIFSTAFLYAALFFSPKASPWLLLFGLALALVRLQSGRFLSVLACNFCFAFGGYGMSAGLFGEGAPFLLPSFVLRLIAGILALLCFLLAFDYRLWRDAWRNRLRGAWRDSLLWTVFGAAIFAASLLLSSLI